MWQPDRQERQHGQSNLLAEFRNGPTHVRGLLGMNLLQQVLHMIIITAHRPLINTETFEAL